MMIPIKDLKQHSLRLLDNNIAIHERIQMATEVRDSLDITHTGEYLNFLQCYFRAFSAILYQHTQPQFVNNEEHQLRNIVVEILYRLPHSEVIRFFIPDILKVAMDLLNTDNEENGILCINLIFDAVKNFKPDQDIVQHLLEFVCKLYQNFSSTVHNFGNGAAANTEATVSVSSQEFEFSSIGGDDLKLMDIKHNTGVPPAGSGFVQLNPSTRSFKIVTEIPVIVIFLSQLYRNLVQKYIPRLLPFMVETISLPGPEKVPPHLKSQFFDLKNAQIKTVAFLSYLLKGFTEYIKPHEESICNSVVNLLVTCPDSVSIRKELLISLKHVLGSDCKRGLFPLIDTLLEERVLVGTGRPCVGSLKTLAYSLLAEYVHNVRKDLSLSQLSRIIYLFSSIMHDAALPFGIHTTSARLMLNLVEPIFEKGVDQATMDVARNLLVRGSHLNIDSLLQRRILDAFVGKFSTVKRTIPQLMEDGERGKARSISGSKLELPVEAVLNVEPTVEHSKEVSNCKHLIKTLVMGMKTIIWSITHAHLAGTQLSISTHGTPPQVLVPTSSNLLVPRRVKGMREDEVWLASGVLKSGVNCLAIFKEKDEEREMVHLFCQIFVIMEPQDLMDVFSLCMPELFDCMISNTQLVDVVSTLLLGGLKVEKHFADVLLNFLVSSKLDVLKHPDPPAAKLVLQLFQFLFVSVSKAPADCERILQPHVHVIMETCIKKATEVEKPSAYLNLLRIMFKALGGKFEMLLRELMTTLEPCLNMLLSMLESPLGEDVRDLLLELCLTLPARLSSLLPHLHHLMKPLVFCLKGSNELVSLGINTLEFWIDSLNPDFLESSMGNVMSEVISAIWSHMKPAPYPWGEKSLQLLGKLGGRNRRFLKEPPVLECKEIPEHGFRTILTFQPSTHFLVPLDRCINLSVAAIFRKNVDVFSRKQALKFLRVCLSSQLNLPGNIIDEGLMRKQLSSSLVSSVGPSCRRSDTVVMKAELSVKTKSQLMAEKHFFKILLTTIIMASGEYELKDPKDEYVGNITRHFAMIFHIDHASCSSSSSSCASRGSVMLSSNIGVTSRPIKTTCDLSDLDPSIFLDALVDVLAGENRLHARAALGVLNIFAETLLFLASRKHTEMLTSRGGSSTPMIVFSPSMSHVHSPTPSVKIPVFEQLLSRLLHCCYGSTWQAKMGGVMGLRALIGKVTVDTLCVFQVRIVRGLVYVLKRLPIYASKEQEETSQVLMQVLRVVNNVDEENSEVRGQSFKGVVEYLAIELFNPNVSVNVSKIVQSCLSLLASRTGYEVSELLEPLYQTLIQPLMLRPLRTKTVDQQVGTVTTLNFCLSLRPPLLKLTQELVNVLQEAVQIVEADETTARSVKFMNSKLATSLNILRTACIELLCAAMAWADFRTPNYSELRAKIIVLFFKSLANRSPEVVAAGKEGLRQAVLHQRIPKELIINSLRPILMNLGQTKNLSIPLLQGLARLLELLSNWFNVALGAKLLDHLKRWLEPEKLAQIQKAWKPGEEPKIAAALIELFHLLPVAAVMFLDELVTMTIDLESALPLGRYYSEINSPYRLPLTKFLNRYPTAAVDYFLARLGQPKYFRRFMYIIRLDAGQPLREDLAKSPNKILEIAFPEFVPKPETSGSKGSIDSPTARANDEVFVKPPSESSNTSLVSPAASSDAYFEGLALIKTLVKLIPGWLQNHHVIFNTLVLLWKSPARLIRLQNEQELSLVQVKESKWLVKCFLNYLRHDETEVNVLFDILSIFLSKTRIDFTFLKEYYIVEVAESYTPSKKKALLQHFLYLFQSEQFDHKHLTVAMQMLILPMLAHAFQNGHSSEVFDASIIKIIFEKLINPDNEISADYDEPLRTEIFQLGTLLLKCRQSDIFHYRKELVKFGWDHLKREDSSTKQWAFVNLCHFLDVYHAPETFIVQLFGHLLKTYQPESKMLVTQASDILMPELSRRCPPGDSRIPMWVHYTKKILVEEGHSVPKFIHIYQLIVRHSDLFYSYRAHFVPQMINSLNRLGLPHNTTAEYRRLSIQLAGLVVNWERKRQNEMKVMTDSDISDRKSDGHSHNSTSVQPIHSADVSNCIEDPLKHLKIEPGIQTLGDMSPGGSSSLPNVETPGISGQPDEEFKTNAAMGEMIINFLIRVALVIEPKDKEASQMYEQALDTLSQALEVWPNANVKFNYLEKLLTSIQSSQAKDRSAALSQGFDIINKLLDKQPHLFLKNNIQQILQILDSCFKLKMSDGGNLFCSILKKVFVSYPLEVESAPREAKILYQKVDDLIKKNLSTQTLGEEDSAKKIGFILSAIETLAEVQKNLIDPSYVVHILQCLAREMSKQDQRTDPDHTVLSKQGDEVAALIENFRSVLKLIRERVMLVPDCKRSIIQVLNNFLSEKSTDPTVLVCILDVIKRWIEDDFSKPGMPVGSSSFLTSKEVVSFLHKLSQVDRMNFSSSALEEWDHKYLLLLYGLCADSDKYPINLRQEVFEKVERQFLLGLRVKDQEMRTKFFSIHHESLDKTLFTRLRYIFQLQDWEALSDVFWIKQGLDLLLAILVENKPITLASNSAKVRPLVDSSSLTVSSTVQPMIIDSPDVAPITLDALISKHSQFLNAMSRLQVADIITPLRDLAHTDANVAYHLWVLVFPIAWVTLPKEEQAALAKPLNFLISKDYHKNQQTSRPNVVQALLEGIQLSHPQPRMPSEIIKYAGKNYNAWHIAISLLESHVMLFPLDAKCAESLADLYRLLNEEDMWCGLWKKRALVAETRAGLSLVQHNYWKRAQGLFYQAMMKATQGVYTNTVHKGEMCLWEDQWLTCAGQLGQWDVLVDFAKHIDNHNILLDTLWKQPDWSYLKDCVVPMAQVEATPKLCIIQAYVTLHEKDFGGLSDAETIAGQGFNLALEQWWQLPELSGHERIPLLQNFQQLVEIQESCKIIKDIADGKTSPGSSTGGARSNYTYEVLKDILETWRLRTPNEWDNTTVWYDLLQWRNEMYNKVIHAFKTLGTTDSQLRLHGYRDKAWNVNKLAHIFRKQGLPDVCVSILENMYEHSTMDTQEAFVKVKEQAKAYLEMKGELMNGLNLINSTSLEYFPLKHKAEIFRLQGDFLLKMHDNEGANLAYSNVIRIFKNIPKGWISWGDYCEIAYKETHEEIWLEYVTSCFLQGIKFGIPNSRSYIARVLYLLSFDTPNKPVGKIFNKYQDKVPNWVWLTWIPQLLLSLQRPEAPHCKLVLLRIATSYPQALYYFLRTYLLERRDIVTKAENSRQIQQRIHQGSQASGGSGSHEAGNSQVQESDRSSDTDGNMRTTRDQTLQQSSSEIDLRRRNALDMVASAVSAFGAAKDIMEALKHKHSNLTSELEIFLTEVGSRFVTMPEERLLSVTNALLHRCYKYPVATTAEVPSSLKKELSGVCRACFTTDALSKHIDFVQEYKQDFERDLDPDNIDTFPVTISKLIERLKYWKDIIQNNLEDRFPAVMKLEEESRVLHDFHTVDIEIPGQYFADQEVATDHTVKLDSIGADIPIVRRSGNNSRRLTLIGSDGSQRHFNIQIALSPNVKTDERMMQLFRALNQMFDKHKESRRRHLKFHIPIIIPVWSQVRMVEDDVMFNTFLDVYENYSARNNRDADQPIAYFKEQLNQAITGQIPQEAVLDLRHQAYTDIIKNMVVDGIISQFMYKTLPSGNHIWAFKKQLAIQLALSNFISVMLRIGGRAPKNILFAKNSGKVFQTDFHPIYDANGMIELSEPVPFRLTRNLYSFFSHFGVESLVCNMCAAAQSIVSPKQSRHLWYHLAMFFRDELICWSWKKPIGSYAPITYGLNPTEFKQKVVKNVEHAVNRVNGMAPYVSEEEDNDVDPSQPGQKGVVELVEAALSPRNLCMMDPTWHPWF